MQTSHTGRDDVLQAVIEVATPRTEAAQRAPVTSKKEGLGSLLGLVVFGAASAAAAAVGGWITSRPKNKRWYRSLEKSRATPPDAVFSVVWPVLYTLSSLSAWRVARTPASPARTRALGWWAAQTAANAAWSPLFFGAHRPRAAMADLVGNVVTLSAYAAEARKVDKTAALLVTPYLGWLGFASLLNATVIRKNATRG